MRRYQRKILECEREVGVQFERFLKAWKRDRISERTEIANAVKISKNT